MKFNYLKRQSRGLLFLIFSLAVINLAVVFYADLDHSRIFRLLTMSLFFIFYFFKKEFNDKRMTAILLLFILRDIFFQFYEIPWGYKGYMFLGILILTAMTAEILPRLRGGSVSYLMVGVAVILVLANTFTMYSLMDTLSFEFHDELEVGLFYLYGALMIVLGAVAISYNNKYNSTRSLYYVVMVFGFLISDIAALLAYYFGYEKLYYLDRFCFIIGLGLFVNHALNYDRAREEIYQYEMIDKDL